MPSQRHRLIVNADDFGLTEGINNAIAELHDAGALHSTTLMATGPAFAHAASLARARSGLGVGCHVVLTDGTPAADPKRVSTLLDGAGQRFHPSLLGFLTALVCQQIDPVDIEREAIAQIRQLQAAGLTVTHIDTHKHTHILPFILRPLLRAARQTGVRALRNPFEQPWAFPLSNGTTARTSQIRLIQPLERSFLAQPALRSGEFRTTDGTIGVSATGNLDEITLRSLVAALPAGTWELVCHPGYSDAALDAIPTRLRSSREVERQALLSVLSAQARAETSHTPPHLPRLELIHYGDLAAAGAHAVALPLR